MSTPPPAAPPPDYVALAKTFITNLRSNAKVLDSATATDLSLTTTWQQVSNDVNSRAQPIAQSTVDAIRLATQGAQFWKDAHKPGAIFQPNVIFNRDCPLAQSMRT